MNVTPADIADLGLVERVDAALRASATPPGALVLEITESDAMRDPERTPGRARGARHPGVRLSIDDFGTGYSSLAYLDRLPSTRSRSTSRSCSGWTRTPPTPPSSAPPSTLAHDLGLRVVAEGVESDLAKSLLTDMGCDLYQGYRLARPMPGTEVLTWLARHEAHTSAMRASVRSL